MRSMSGGAVRNLDQYLHRLGGQTIRLGLAEFSCPKFSCGLAGTQQRRTNLVRIEWRPAAVALDHLVRQHRHHLVCNHL